MTTFIVWRNEEIDEWRAGLEFAKERLEYARTSEVQTFWQRRVEQIEGILQLYEAKDGE
jgi:hypothetical protein